MSLAGTGFPQGRQKLTLAGRAIEPTVSALAPRLARPERLGLFSRAIAKRFDTPGTSLKVGGLARRTGLTVRALHHCDSFGLLHPTARTALRAADHWRHLTPT